MWCGNWQAPPKCLISKGCFCTTRLLFICCDDLLPLFDQWSLTAVGRRASLVEISYLISLLFGYLTILASDELKEFMWSTLYAIHTQHVTKTLLTGRRQTVPLLLCPVLG